MDIWQSLVAKLFDINHMINEERRMSPMKKKLVVLLAAVMMLVSTTTVLAAPSTTKAEVEMGTVEELKAAVTSATSTAGEVKLEAVSANSDAAIELGDFVKEVVALLNADEELTTDYKAKVLGLADISIPGADLSAGVEIKVAVDGIYSTDSKDTIIALHYNGETWENDTIEVVKVERGFVTIKVTDLSPVAFVKVIPEAGKFGAGFTVLPLVAVASLAGAVVTGKKANK